MFTFSFKNRLNNYLRKFIFGLFAFSAIAFMASNSPQAQAANCGPLNMLWGVGPNASTAYIDLCYVNMGTNDIDDDFTITDISGSGVKSGNNIMWGGAADCNAFARVTTKNCGSSITGDCAWIGVQTQPKAGQNNGGYNVTPIAHVRYPSGAEENVSMYRRGLVQILIIEIVLILCSIGGHFFATIFVSYDFIQWIAMGLQLAFIAALIVLPLIFLYVVPKLSDQGYKIAKISTFIVITIINVAILALFLVDIIIGYFM